MGGRLAVAGVKATIETNLAMANRFSKYAPETEHAVRGGIPVKEHAAVKDLLILWENMAFQHKPLGDHKCLYSDLMERLAKGPAYSAEDVELFSIALKPMEQEEDFVTKCGVFLSALVNSGKEGSFRITTAHLDEPPEFLGYRNRKELLISGDAGNCVGHDMSCGKITVQGNAGCFAGLGMGGGELHLEGDYKSLGSLLQGRIYHRGELIFPR